MNLYNVVWKRNSTASKFTTGEIKDMHKGTVEQVSDIDVLLMHFIAYSAELGLDVTIAFKVYLRSNGGD